MYHVCDVRVERRVYRENLIEGWHTDRKYAARSRLIQRSTVSCVEIDGSHALAVYVHEQ